ncbi:MAG: class I SAM-dependent methyltransferase [Chlorobi bacterium]|nr:class I SAM-dependent methyltransferase [Chlorobiota bacterium]
MSLEKLKDEIGNMDIYLLDQILKGRYLREQIILDAGCGNGRNLKWFYNNSYTIFGIDGDVDKIEEVKKQYIIQCENFTVNSVENLPFENESFHHILCNAVLHFAENEAHFYNMFSELVRVLKPNGSLFIRTASDIGIEDKVLHLTSGVYTLPDKTERFLLTKSLLDKITKKYYLSFLEPLKTVNVNDKRSMTTLVLQKP